MSRGAASTCLKDARCEAALLAVGGSGRIRRRIRRRNRRRPPAVEGQLDVPPTVVVAQSEPGGEGGHRVGLRLSSGCHGLAIGLASGGHRLASGGHPLEIIARLSPPWRWSKKSGRVRGGMGRSRLIGTHLPRGGEGDTWRQIEVTRGHSGPGWHVDTRGCRLTRGRALSEQLVGHMLVIEVIVLDERALAAAAHLEHRRHVAGAIPASTWHE